jgi:hypothetical protein
MLYNYLNQVNLLSTVAVVVVADFVEKECTRLI